MCVHATVFVKASTGDRKPALPMLHPARQTVLPDPKVEAQVFIRFDADRLGRPEPSAARRAADRAGREPEEELGLYVAPKPRVGGCWRGRRGCLHLLQLFR